MQSTEMLKPSQKVLDTVITVDLFEYFCNNQTRKENPKKLVRNYLKR